MYEKIYTAWQNEVTKSPYSDSLPLFQRKDLFMGMLTGICSANGDIHYSLPNIIDFVESNSLNYQDFINSLFILRDVLSENKDLLEHQGIDIQQPLASLQYIIVKIGSYFSYLRMDLNIRHRRVKRIDSERIEGNILYLDHSFNIKKTTSSLLNHFGYEKDEVLGENVNMLFSTSSRSILQHAMESLRNNKRFKIDLEAEAQKKNGQRFQALLKIARLNTHDHPPQYSVYLKDNTYIHETKSVLNLLSMALESAGEGIVIFEPDLMGTILYVNEAMEKMSGYARHQLLGKPLHVLRDPDAAGSVEQEIIDASLKEGWKGEVTNLHRKGHPYIVDLHTQPIKNEYGKIVAVVGIERDITTDKSRQAQIIYLKKFVEHIVNNLPHYVIVTDGNQIIKFWNKSLEIELGISPADAIGGNILDVLPALNRFHFDIAARNVLSTGNVFTKKFLADFNQKGDQYYQLFITPIHSAQENTLLWTIQNITKEELLKVRITWQNARLKFLENFSQLLNTNLDLRSIFLKIAKELREILPFKTLSFLLPYNLEKMQFGLHFFSHHGEDEFPQTRILDMSQQLIYQELLESKEPQVQNFEHPAENLHKPESDYHIGQIVHMPIVFENEVLGILNLGHTDAHYYQQDDLDFLSQITSHLAIALKNSFYFNLTEVQNRKLSIINSIFNAAQSYSSIPQIYQTALEGLNDLLQSDECMFYISADGKSWDVPPGLNHPHQIPGLLHWPVNSYQQRIRIWDTTRQPPQIAGMLKNVEERSGLFAWEFSRALGHIGFVAIDNSILHQFKPDFIGSLVQDILKQMTLAIDQLHLFEKIKYAEQEWQTTFNTVRIGLAVVDREYRLIQTNKAFTELFDMEEKNALGKTCRDIFCPKKVTADYCYLDTGKVDTQPVETEYYEERVSRRFKRTFYPLFTSNGDFNGGIFSVYDITHQREQEDKIQFLSQFPETNPNMVISLDSTGTPNYLNPSAKNTLDRLGLKKQDLNRILPAELQKIIKNVAENEEIKFEFEHKFLDHVFEYIVYSPKDDSNFYIYGTEITDKVELHRQLLQTERIRAIGEMAAGVAHDFNNLLATILGRTQLLLLKSENNQFKKELNIIEKAAIDGGEIVQRIQEVTREKRDKNYQPLDVNKLIQESIIFSANKLKINTQLKGKPVRLQTNLQENLVCKGNPVELKEVFTNLLLNAYDAMPNGGELCITSQSTEDGNIQIVIQDTGTGMSEEIQNKIFNPFFTTKGEKGTGLGLSIVYNTITEHGGHIRLESRPLQGSTFTIALPITDEHPEQSPGNVPNLEHDIGEYRLLIVDDEPELLDTMAEILRLKFQRVEIANSGYAALKKLEKQSYDVVLTDLGMPEMSGWELAERVKEKLPDSRVILVTGWGDQAREELKHHPYVDEILPKPYELFDLINLISRISVESLQTND